MIKFRPYLSLLLVFITLAIFSTNALAHGYVISPASRGYQGSLEKNSLGYTLAFQKYGIIVNEPQSLEAPKGFPLEGPADGHIASANGALGGDFTLDNQTADRWTKTNIATGINAFVWKYNAYHATAKWHYYMTKPGWDPNKPISRADLELIGEVAHNGTPPSDNVAHQISVPQNRQGYHIILAVWDIADTKNAFYNVIDVNVTPADGSSTAPNTPTGLKAENITSSSAKISWIPQSGATSYHIFRDEKAIKEVSVAEFQDQALLPNTSYTYKIVAKGATGLTSAKSEALVVKTIDANNTEKPTAPANLHAMDVTENSVSLMWGGASHTQGIKRYQVFQNGVKLVETIATNFNSNGLASDTEYSYTVKAIALNDQISDASNELKVRTKTTSTEKPTAPANLHAMDITENSVSLMWGASSHTQGIKYYQVFKDGTKIAETAQTSYSSTGLVANTIYSYTVKAVALNDQVSGESNVLNVTTKNSANSGSFCGAQIYDAGKAYPTAKTKVFYSCIIWESKWYVNPNEVPGVSPVWEEVGVCTEGSCKDNLPVTYCGAQPYSATKTYNKTYTRVFIDCKIWENQWYANPGEKPGQSLTWKFVSNCNESPDCTLAKTSNVQQGANPIIVTNNLIDFSLGNPKKINEVSVFSIQGIRVLSSKNSGQTSIDISSLQPGLYIIKTIYSDGNNEVRKVIKK